MRLISAPLFPYVSSACNLTPSGADVRHCLTSLLFLHSISRTLTFFSQLFCKSTPVDELTGSGSCFRPVKEFGGQPDSVSLRGRLEETEQVVGSRPAEKKREL